MGFYSGVISFLGQLPAFVRVVLGIVLTAIGIYGIYAFFTSGSGYFTSCGLIWGPILLIWGLMDMAGGRGTSSSGITYYDGATGGPEPTYAPAPKCYQCGGAAVRGPDGRIMKCPWCGAPPPM